MYVNKADQVLMNEVSKINKKIKSHERDILKLNAEKEQLLERLNDKELNDDYD